MDAATVDVYERRAGEWLDKRGESTDGLGTRFRTEAGPGPVADLGCGGGRWLAEIGPPAFGVDASAAMLGLARRKGVPLVRADLEALPFATGTLAGAFARHSYLHLPKPRLGPALADLHRVLRPRGLVFLTVIEGDYEGNRLPGDDFEGRFFACWGATELAGVFEASGFREIRVERVTRRRGGNDLLATARR